MYLYITRLHTRDMLFILSHKSRHSRIRARYFQFRIYDDKDELHLHIFRINNENENICRRFRFSRIFDRRR